MCWDFTNRDVGHPAPGNSKTLFLETLQHMITADPLSYEKLTAQMNSRERRVLRRALGQIGVNAESLSKSQSSETKTPKPTRLPPENRAAPILRQSAKRVWGGVLIVATLCGLYIFRPDVSIEPYVSTDPSQPFGQNFFVQNNSLYSITNVRPSCGFEHLTFVNGGTWTDSQLGADDQNIDQLEHGDKTTLRCLIRLQPEVKIGSVVMVAVVHYKILGISLCKTARFDGANTPQGGFVWTYNGNSPCYKWL